MRRFIVGIFMLAASYTIPVEAMQVTPLSVEMESVGIASRASLLVRNTREIDLPVEFSVVRFTLDENGERTEFDDAEDDFLIFPPQAIIKPYGQQTVRVQWLGDPTLAKSQHYYITAKQVPVETESTERFRIQLVFNIRSLVSVKPAAGAPSVSVLGAQVITDEDGEKRVQATLENRSNVHATLRQSNISLTVYDAAGTPIWSKTPNLPERQQRIGVGILQANARRNYVFPYELPAEIAARASRAQVEISTQRPR